MTGVYLVYCSTMRVPAAPLMFARSVDVLRHLRGHDCSHRILAAKEVSHEDVRAIATSEGIGSDVAAELERCKVR